MKLGTGLILSVLISLTLAYEQFETSDILIPSSHPVFMRNFNFPYFAPPEIVQIWNYKFNQQPGLEQGIHMQCELKIPIDLNNKICIDNVTIVDGRYTFPLCRRGTYNYTSFTNEIRVSLITEEYGGSFINCALQVINVRRPDYLKQENEEIDSSEHGGEEGDKGTTCPCGWANKATSRIVNGTMTAKNEFPFIARIVNNTGSLRCGGTIITRYHVLTAAHCTYNLTTQNLSVIVGGHDQGSHEGYLIPIERISQHNDYNHVYITNDITLLTLANQIPFSQSIGPACLPHADPALQLVGKYITSIGWGAVFSKGWTSQYLMKVHVKVIPMEECHKMFKKVDAVNPTQICDYATYKSSCQGDSGGPVVWVDPETNRYTLVGVTSFGKTCADYHPSVETRVQAYISWIQNEIANSGKSNSRTCSKV